MTPWSVLTAVRSPAHPPTHPPLWHSDTWFLCSPPQLVRGPRGGSVAVLPRSRSQPGLGRREERSGVRLQGKREIVIVSLVEKNITLVDNFSYIPHQSCTHVFSYKLLRNSVGYFFPAIKELINTWYHSINTWYHIGIPGKTWILRTRYRLFRHILSYHIL